jgi:MFS superfamily sulfate permease-like transporter
MPQAALAAVVVATTAGLFKPSEFAEIRQVRRMEFWWALTAMVGVVLLGTLDGILVAVALSVAVLFYQANRPPVYVVGHRRGTSSFEPLSASRKHDELQTWPGLLVVRIEGRVHFANAHRIGDRLWSLVHEARPRVVLLDMSAVTDLEYTALKALTAADEKLASTGTSLWLASLTPGVRDVIERAPLGRVLGSDRIFASLSHAVQAYVDQKASWTAR